LVELVADTCKLLLKDNSVSDNSAESENKDDGISHSPGETFEPAHHEVEKHEEAMIEAPDSAKEELLSAPESLEHHPENETEHNEGIRQF
jgi:hypothetical protein